MLLLLLSFSSSWSSSKSVLFQKNDELHIKRWQLLDRESLEKSVRGRSLAFAKIFILKNGQSTYNVDIDINDYSFFFFFFFLIKRKTYI